MVDACRDYCSPSQTQECWSPFKNQKIKKALDHVEFFALSRFGFGHKFLKWVNIVYSSPTAAIRTKNICAPSIVLPPLSRIRVCKNHLVKHSFKIWAQFRQACEVKLSLLGPIHRNVLIAPPYK